MRTRLFLTLLLAVTSTPALATDADRIRSMAVPIDGNSELPVSVQEHLRSQRIVLLGEMHGTAEIPAMFGEMVKSAASSERRILVALEIFRSSQSNVDQFLKTGDEATLQNDPFFTRETQDGRSSKAIVTLLRELSHIPGIEIFCMDTGGPTNQARDTGIAQAITDKAKSFDSVFVLTGNIHSRTTRGLPWDPQFRPMGHELLSMNPDWKSSDVTNILVRYQGGSSWVCMPECGSHNWPTVSSDYTDALGLDRYFLLEDGPTDGHNSTLFIRTIHASEPFLSR